MSPAFVLGLVLAQIQATPPRHAFEPGCEVWSGEVRGNDTGAVVVTLCPGPVAGSAHGTYSWKSPRTGTCLRAIEGSWVGDRFVGKDVRIVEEHPEPSWRPGEAWTFCMVDEYDLVKNAEHLEGTFVARDCPDRGTIRLLRDRSAVVALPPPPPAAEERPPPPETPRGCLSQCGVAPTSSPTAIGVLALAWLSLRIAVRRRRP